MLAGEPGEPVFLFSSELKKLASTPSPPAAEALSLASIWTYLRAKLYFDWTLNRMLSYRSAWCRFAGVLRAHRRLAAAGRGLALLDGLLLAREKHLLVFRLYFDFAVGHGLNGHYTQLQ